MIIGLNKILGTQTINLETGEIIDNSVIDCFGGGGGGGTTVIYKESPQSIAYRHAQLEREKERVASENKIKADASVVKADWESRSGMQSLSRSGTYNAPAEQNVGLLAEATRTARDLTETIQSFHKACQSPRLIYGTRIVILYCRYQAI